MWHDIKLLNASANALIGVLLLALLGASLWWLAQRPMFTLRAIRIESGSATELRHIDPLTVRGSAVPHIKGNFFTANLDAVRVAFESVPWVRRATVRRDWPDKLVVTLEEHVPLGTWGEDGRLVSVNGEVFIANLAEAEEDGELPGFDGPEGSEKEVVARFHELHDWFAPANLAPDQVRLSVRYAWSVTLNNGMTVELGREQSKATMRERVARLVAVYPQLLARLQNRIENVDMRYPNGMAIRASGMAFGFEGKKK